MNSYFPLFYVDKITCPCPKLYADLTNVYKNKGLQDWIYKAHLFHSVIYPFIS